MRSRAASSAPGSSAARRPSASSSTPGILRHPGASGRGMPRDLRLLAAAVALSAAGDMLLVVVLALRVHDLSGSGFAVAALFGALMLPVVLLAPLAGRLVDGFETRRVLLLVSLAQLVVAGGLVFADDVAAILVLTALVGAGAAIAGPAEAALVPAAAAGGDLARANGWV